MIKDVQDFIEHCDTCARCKYDTVATPRLLHPLPIPSRIWESITTDFIEGPHKSNCEDTIWVVIDHMSKYVHFVALSQPYTVATPQHFMDQIYKLHGALVEIISDRDPVYVSNFWKEFLRRSDREFQIGQWVLLKLQPYRQISTAARSSQKLAPRYYGPYRILEKVGPVAYKLQLPENSQSTQHSCLFTQVIPGPLC